MTTQRDHDYVDYVTLRLPALRRLACWPQPRRAAGHRSAGQHDADVPAPSRLSGELVSGQLPDHQGFPALLTLGVGQGAADGRSLCIPDADGVLLSFSGHANSSMVRLFEHHVRLLGPNQAHWTTKPLG